MSNTKEIKKYIIVCDESTRYGNRFSYFYGGAMIEESKYQKISEVLEMLRKKNDLSELKRTKIDLKNYNHYIDVLELFFTFIRSGDIKSTLFFNALML